MSHARVEKLTYQEGVPFEAHVAIPDARGGRLPAVLVHHAFAGQTDFERGKAEQIAAELGYVGIAVDLYGKGVLGKDGVESAKLMAPFMRDRGLLRRRLAAWLQEVRRHPAVDPSRIGAIGFCFGGLCALDLARSGADVRGVCSFHGLLSAPEGLPAEPIHAKVLVLHGHEDPMATPEQLLAFEQEMTGRGADWQVHVYGGAMHGFAHPRANNREGGILYHPVADRRSWIAMKAFFEEVLA